MNRLNTFQKDPWSIFDELVSLQKGFNDLLGQTSPRTDSQSYPALDVWIGQDQLILDAELPGVDPKDVKIEVAGDRLTLTGKAGVDEVETDKQGVWHRKERPRGEFARTLQLPFRAEANNVKAAYRNGILRVTIPKAESERPRRIPVEE